MTKGFHHLMQFQCHRIERALLVYARELYLQFLVLNDMDSKNASSDKSGHETAN